MRQLRLPILERLHQDHRVTLALLERLENLLRRHKPTRPPAPADADVRDVLVDLVQVMETEISSHYAFEEEHLFPRFAALADSGIPMMLKSEHDVIRPVAVRLAELARTAADSGFTAETWTAFHALGQEMAEREIFHIQKEEMGFLPALDHLLQPEDGAALLEAYQAMSSGA